MLYKGIWFCRKSKKAIIRSIFSPNDIYEQVWTEKLQQRWISAYAVYGRPVITHNVRDNHGVVIKRRTLIAVVNLRLNGFYLHGVLIKPIVEFASSELETFAKLVRCRSFVVQFVTSLPARTKRLGGENYSVEYHATIRNHVQNGRPFYRQRHGSVDGMREGLSPVSIRRHYVPSS